GRWAGRRRRHATEGWARALDRGRGYPVGMRSRIATVAAAAGVSAGLSGCVSPENDRMTIGRSARPGSIPPALKESPAAPPAATPTLETAAPSVTGIDRGHWARTRILVPVDGIVHRPTYARHVIVADRTARQQRRYPTAEKALELWGGSESDQQAE